MIFRRLGTIQNGIDTARITADLAESITVHCRKRRRLYAVSITLALGRSVFGTLTFSLAFDAKYDTEFKSNFQLI